MTGHEKIAAKNIKGAFNYIVGGYYNCIQDEEPEALPKSRQELFDEIYSSAFTDKYVCGGCVGKAPDEMRFAGTEFCTTYLNKLLDTDSDVTEIAEVAGWKKEEVIMKYESKRNPGTYCTLVSSDDKYKTHLLRFEDGREQNVTDSTLKRWYKKVVIEPEVVSQPEPQEPSSSQLDSITVETETVSKKEKPKKNKPKKANVDCVEITQLQDFIFQTVTELGADIFVPAKDIKFRSFKVGGHMMCTFNYSSKSVTLKCRSKAVQQTDYKPSNVVKSMFDYHYRFTKFNDDIKKQIEILLKSSYKYQEAKNNKKSN